MTVTHAVSERRDIFLTILSGVQMLLRNPALDALGIGNILKVLNFGALVVSDAVNATEHLKEIALEIQGLVKEGRAPTKLEWESWRTRAHAADLGWEEIE